MNRNLIPLAAAALIVIGGCRESTAPDGPRVLPSGATFVVKARQAGFRGTDTAYVDIILANPRDTTITLRFDTECEILPYVLKPDGEPLFPYGFYSCGNGRHDKVLAAGVADTVVISLNYDPVNMAPLEPGRYDFMADIGPFVSGQRLVRSNRVGVRYTR